MPSTGPGKGGTEIMNGYRTVKNHNGDAYGALDKALSVGHTHAVSSFPQALPLFLSMSGDK